MSLNIIKEEPLKSGLHKSKSTPCLVEPLIQQKPKSIEEMIESFDCLLKTLKKSQIIQELREIFEIKKSIHLEIPTKIRYLSRKFELPSFLLPIILRDLKDRSILKDRSSDLKIRINLAQAIKYGVRNKLDIGYEELLELFEGNSADFKSEIVWALGYKIKNAAGELTRELIERINSKITQDIAPEAKAFLKSQISQHDFTMNEDVWQENNDFQRIFDKIGKRKPQTIVTKNQQTTRSTSQNQASQELNFDVKSILERLKQKRVILDPGIEEEKQEEEKSKGSHRSWMGGTYTDAKKLYERAGKGYVITDEDKDGYLTTKFLDDSKYRTGGILGDLLIDRMIAATFKLISKKQKLADCTIEKLVICLEKASFLAKYYFRNEKREVFIKNFLNSWVPTAPNEIEKPISNEFQAIKNVLKINDNIKDDINDDIIKIVEDLILTLKETVFRSKFSKNIFFSLNQTTSHLE